MHELIGLQKIALQNQAQELQLLAGHEHFLLIAQGSCSLQLGSTAALITQESVWYFPANQTPEISLHSADSQVYWLHFSKSFHPHFFFDTHHLSCANLQLELKQQPALSHLVQLCEMLHYELEKTLPLTAILQPLVASFFAIYYSELENKLQLEQPSKCNFHVNRLLELIEQNYRSNHSLSFYAEKLVLTERQLNSLSNTYFQKSMLQLITTRKIIEAQKELMHTEKTITEIGYDLGFNEKSYFTRVFKKHTGQTPSEFQNAYFQHA